VSAAGRLERSARFQLTLFRSAQFVVAIPRPAFHNGGISELNAIEGVSVNELYVPAADHGSPVKPTITHPPSSSSPW